MVLSSIYEGSRTYYAQGVKDTKDETAWEDSVLHRQGVCDIDEHSYCDCFKHLSILSLYMFSFLWVLGT